MVVLALCLVALVSSGWRSLGSVRRKATHQAPAGPLREGGYDWSTCRQHLQDCQRVLRHVAHTDPRRRREKSSSHH